MGSATRIKGIEQYFEVSLSARAAKLPMFSDLKTSVKAPKKVKLKDYIMCYGLLLRLSLIHILTKDKNEFL